MYLCGVYCNHTQLSHCFITKCEAAVFKVTSHTYAWGGRQGLPPSIISFLSFPSLEDFTLVLNSPSSQGAFPLVQPHTLLL